jgi:hypothetical protein
MIGCNLSYPFEELVCGCHVPAPQFAASALDPVAQYTFTRSVRRSAQLQGLGMRIIEPERLFAGVEGLDERAGV